MSPPVDPMSVSGAHTLQILSRTCRLPWGHRRTRERSGTRELGLVPSFHAALSWCLFQKLFIMYFLQVTLLFISMLPQLKDTLPCLITLWVKDREQWGQCPLRLPRKVMVEAHIFKDSWHWPPTVPCQVLLDEGWNGVFASGLRITVRAFPGIQRCFFVSAVMGFKAWLLCGLEITQTLSPPQ